MTVEHVGSDLLKLRFETGTELEVTPTHRLFAEGSGWVPASELKPGVLLRSDKRAARLAAVEPARPNQRVFNIEVGLEHAYRVSTDRIWAHNQCVLAMSAERQVAWDQRILRSGLPDKFEEDLAALVRRPDRGTQVDGAPLAWVWYRSWGRINYDVQGELVLIRSIVVF